MNTELSQSLEQLSPILRIETYQREIALLYRDTQVNPKPDAFVSKFPFVIIAETDLMLGSREKLGISYTETDGEITPVWMDETCSFQEPFLYLKVLSRFAVIADPNARDLNNKLKENIRGTYSKLNSIHMTTEQFRIKYDELAAEYDAAIIDYAYKNQYTLLPQLAEALKTKLDSMKSSQTL